MKFQKYFESEAKTLSVDEDFRKALVRYKILKKHIAIMDTAAVHARNAQPAEGECCICLEPFHFASHMITTRCAHSFHPTCLVRALGTGSCTSCPLCRRTAAGLVPAGAEGDCLRFLAMVHVNARALQHCHDAAMRAIHASLADACAEEPPSRLWPWAGAQRRAALADDAEAAAAALDAIVRFATLNYEGLRKILKKFDKRTGFCVAGATMAELRRSSFIAETQVRACGAIGGGRRRDW